MPQILGVISTLFYGSRFPERCSLGRFDLFKQSHTIFHIILSIALFAGLDTGVIEFTSRNLETRLSVIHLFYLALAVFYGCNLWVCCSSRHQKPNKQ